MGPTASGKTALALELAEKHNCEIISVDSALVYKEMNVGTAKPSKEELARAPHRLIDILDPIESYSAADFRRDAINGIENIIKSGKTPLLVGGTMLYFKALLEGLSPLPEAVPEIRAQIMKEAEQHGWQWIHEELKKVDPVSAERIHGNDPQRLSRAIEVFRISGKSLTELTQVKAEPLPYDFVQFAIAPTERKTLHELIAKRFEIMLEQGFVEEVTKLKQRGDLDINLPSMRCVGYRQCWQYLDGEFDYNEMSEKVVAATRQLAKRQLTWLRSWGDLNWLESGAEGNVVKVTQHL
ncbi:tRNA (adenosine(37)-N6)-dimethylallyltransferase MiaA [Shewanella sp. OPT22]|nr:tRNA (adenosine(37)-N6)-dimethylallyltransferase MiaA [Shewanella sp. OPT22]